MKQEFIAHLSEQDLALARMCLGQDIYPQRMGDDLAIWLRLGCGAHTMIGYGRPDEALAQADTALDDLREYMHKSVRDFCSRQYIQQDSPK